MTPTSVGFGTALFAVSLMIIFVTVIGWTARSQFQLDEKRKRAEEELCESEARLQAILDNSPGMVFLKDVEGRYLHVNRQFESTFHMTREQVVGKTDEAIFVPEQAAVFRANDLKALRAGVPLEFDLMLAPEGRRQFASSMPHVFRRVSGR